MKIKFVNPYNEDKMLTKTINPNARGYVAYPDGGFSFEFTACCGRHFCLEQSTDGKYKFMSAYYPEDPWDWSEYDEEDFSVIG